MPTNQRYIPIDPAEVRSDTTKSYAILRVKDNAHLLASKIPFVDADIPGLSAAEQHEANPLRTDMASAILPAAHDTLLHILNHPNIVSLLEVVINGQDPSPAALAGPLGNFSVWEDMNAGTLDSILPMRVRDIPALGDRDRWTVLGNQQFDRASLPESLCWHVLRSVARALLWLHDGIRPLESWQPGFGEPAFLTSRSASAATSTANMVAAAPIVYGPPVRGWQPILMRKLDPESVFFKHPEAGETYGICKLGNFKWAKVCADRGAVGYEQPNETEGEFSDKQMFFWAPEHTKSSAPWTQASDIYALGSTLYTMMCGNPPSLYRTNDWNISRLVDGAPGYSAELIDLVAGTLSPQPSDRPSAHGLASAADDAFTRWRRSAPEATTLRTAEDVGERARTHILEQRVERDRQRDQARQDQMLAQMRWAHDGAQWSKDGDGPHRPRAPPGGPDPAGPSAGGASAPLGPPRLAGVPAGAELMMGGGATGTPGDAPTRIEMRYKEALKTRFDLQQLVPERR